eukprot:CAMPEP_0182416932 /NCGR_PEP_ID=MMETSP1167-20130531/1335_1 /TAXON_ID=2988 /ORGANISM="Mallomonas Sp, Strain CCMP3275" /LENGTH=194 /DNA_ID=CAMNT_0024590125 /DNA_START=74 /DNA_END=658 /DNA_ORIENTATION=-
MIRSLFLICVFLAEFTTLSRGFHTGYFKLQRFSSSNLSMMFGTKKSKPSKSVTDTFSVRFLPSNKVTQANIGDSVVDVAAGIGLNIPFKCKKGECGTCEVNMNSKWVKSCQTPAIPAPVAGEELVITIKPPKVKKSATFFSPKSFVDGVVNNGLGVIGFVGAVADADDEFSQRMAKEKALAEKVAAAKAAKNKK